MRWVGVVARTLYVAAAVAATISWRCPALDTRPAAACECDVPRTLRCAGDHTALQIIGAHLKKLNQQPNTASAISLLDLTLRGVAVLTASGAAELAGAHLRGLVVSSGELRRVQRGAFAPLANTLQALGLPNNQLTSVPTESLVPLYRLDRLDLSNNRIKSLEAESFMGFNNISFLDLSDNQLITISSESVGALKRLRVLRVRGNQLTIPTLSSLKEVKSLRELDLSANKLTGPLGPSTMPSLKSLVSLQLADNSFKSVRRGALAGLTNLTYLGLHNNQIDVLEDYAFRQLANLTELDLSHNEIVTVSGNSLSHLSKLVKLDMSHNFLRSLSAEPLRSLKSLRELQLHDNDVSMVDDEALLDHHQLTRLTMTDNPLNCDCLLSGFARWLREAKMLPSTDVKDAVCATPPHLEGALLVHLSKQTLCDDHDSAIHRQPGGTPDVFLDADKAIDYSYADPVDNSSRVVSQEEDDMDEYGQEEVDYGDSSPELPFPLDNSLPISQSKVILTHHTFDGRSLRLWWSGAAGRCDALFAYARAGTRERLAAARRVRCERTARGLRASLTVDDSLVIGNSYRFCIALLESTVGSGDLSLALGCSEMFPLAITEPVAPFVPVVPIAVRESNIRVSGVISNVTSEGILSIEVLLSGFPPIRSQDLLLQPPNAEYLQAIHRCFILITVLAGNILVVQREVPCSKPTISMEGFLQGPYQICAKLAEIPERKLNSKCSTAEMQHTILSSGVMKTTYKGINLALVGVSFGLLTIVLALVWATRKLLKKPAEFDQGHQCFRPEAPVVEDGQHSRYLKLQATSNV